LCKASGIRLVVPRLGETRTVLVGVAGMATAAVLYTIASATWEVYLAISIGAISGMVQPSIRGDEQQGRGCNKPGRTYQGATPVDQMSIAAIIGPPLYTQTLARFSGPDAIIRLPGMTMLLSSGISFVALLLLA